eukprot:487417_1
MQQSSSKPADLQSPEYWSGLSAAEVATELLRVRPCPKVREVAADHLKGILARAKKVAQVEAVLRAVERIEVQLTLVSGLEKFQIRAEYRLLKLIDLCKFPLNVTLLLKSVSNLKPGMRGKQLLSKTSMRRIEDQAFSRLRSFLRESASTARVDAVMRGIEKANARDGLLTRHIALLKGAAAEARLRLEAGGIVNPATTKENRRANGAKGLFPEYKRMNDSVVKRKEFDGLQLKRESMRQERFKAIDAKEKAARLEAEEKQRELEAEAEMPPQTRKRSRLKSSYQVDAHSLSSMASHSSVASHRSVTSHSSVSTPQKRRQVPVAARSVPAKRRSVGTPKDSRPNSAYSQSSSKVPKHRESWRSQDPFMNSSNEHLSISSQSSILSSQATILNSQSSHFAEPVSPSAQSRVSRSQPMYLNGLAPSRMYLNRQLIIREWLSGRGLLLLHSRKYQLR